MLEPGTTVDGYRVLERIGEGGTAAVYEVVHTRLGSRHALKVLELASPESQRQLLLEGRVQASVRHPNLVAVTDLVHVGDDPALVLEYVEGPTLDAWLARGRPPLAEALELFRGIVRGVEAAHAAGLVHRDLKPANVLLARIDGGGTLPKITDFGLAKDLEAHGPAATDPGLAVGTPHYMAPEQHRGEAVDTRADLWALGCLLYELVTGRRPFDGRSALEIGAAVCEGRYVPPERLVPDLPDAVRAAIVGLLEPDPARRIASCAELLQVLDRRTPPSIANVDTVVPRARQVRPPAPVRRPPTRSPTRRLALAAWAAALVAGGLFDLWLVAAPPVRAEPAVVVAPATAAAALAVVEDEPPEPPSTRSAAPPAPERPVGILTIAGDARSVRITDTSGRRVGPGALPAGRYRWQATFDGGTATGTLDVRGGRRVTLECAAFLMQCRVER